MEKLKIITDSTADLPFDIYEKYEIEVLPLLIEMEGKTYTDGVDIDLKTLLHKIDNCDTFPTTSQVNPNRFYEVYKRYIEEGYKVLSIHLSSKMSGTYQSAIIAKDMIKSDNIIVIDSLNVTSGLGILVIKAGELRNKGLQIEKIEEEILKNIPNVRTVQVFDTLQNLIKGGRLSKAKGTIGHMLNMKPLLSIEDGTMVQIGKERGMKKAINKMYEIIESYNIKEGQLVLILHADNISLREEVTNEIKKYTSNIIFTEVGCVVGVHAGRGAVGVFLIENK